MQSGLSCNLYFMYKLCYAVLFWPCTLLLHPGPPRQRGKCVICYLQNVKQNDCHKYSLHRTSGGLCWLLLESWWARNWPVLAHELPSFSCPTLSEKQVWGHLHRKQNCTSAILAESPLCKIHPLAQSVCLLFSKGPKKFSRPNCLLTPAMLLGAGKLPQFLCMAAPMCLLFPFISFCFTVSVLIR